MFILTGLYLNQFISKIKAIRDLSPDLCFILYPLCIELATNPKIMGGHFLLFAECVGSHDIHYRSSQIVTFYASVLLKGCC